MSGRRPERRGACGAWVIVVWFGCCFTLRGPFGLRAQEAAPEPEIPVETTSTDGSPEGGESATLVAAERGAVDTDPSTEERVLTGKVTFVLADGIYVDLGREAGLAPKATGIARSQSDRVGRFEIVHVARNSAFLRLEQPPGEPPLTAGTVLELEFDQPLERGEAGDDGSAHGPVTEGDFDRPLLTPRGVVDARGSRNIFHGRITARQWYQRTSDSDLDYLRTRLQTNGTLDRMGGTAWALEWDFDFHYRLGDGLEDVYRHEELDPRFRRLSIVRRFDDRSILRLGRFLPYELPSVGFVDGVQGEMPLGERFRVGAVFGFKPKRINLDVSSTEPLVSTYLSYLWEGDGSSLYSATGGFLASLWDGDVDRGAFILDQRYQRGAFSLTSHAIVDLDVGASEVRDGVRLTEANAILSYDLGTTRLRGGVDRFELLDNEGTRSTVEERILPDTAFVRDTATRYFVGARHQLTDAWSIDEEVSFTHEDQTDGFRWAFGVTRSKLGESERASVTMRVFSLKADQLDGFGGHLSGYLPCSERWTLQPTLRFEWAEFDTGSEDFVVSDVALRSYWRLDSSWSVEAGASYGLQEDDDRFLIDVGVTLRW